MLKLVILYLLVDLKTKNTKVKSIGKDEHGMPTINGKKVVNFRIPKKVDEMGLLPPEMV